LGVVLLAGCATTREVTISARPADATLAVDGENRGTGPIREKFRFGEDDVHRITASHLGYTTQTIDLTRNDDRKDVAIELKPRTRQVTIRVSPMPAKISLDGTPVGDEPVTET